MTNGFQLVAGILGAGLGVITIVSGRIQSSTIREMGATGSAARFVGALFVIMSAVILIDWVKKFRKSRR